MAAGEPEQEHDPREEEGCRGYEHARKHGRRPPRHRQRAEQEASLRAGPVVGGELDFVRRQVGQVGDPNEAEAPGA
jgi:hypothetical protein